MATLTQMITRVRQRSNNEYTNGQFVTDAELTGLINVAYKDLYGTLVEHSLHRAESTDTITATGATSYSLEADLYAVLNVYLVESGRRTRLPRHSDRLKPGTLDVGTAQSYRVRGSSIVFYPTPASGTYEVDYIPVPSDLSAGSDELDGVLGWEEYVVLDVAIKVLRKEGSLEEAEALVRDRDRLLSRIEDQANLVEFSESVVISNNRENYGPDEGAFWPRRGYRGSIR
jgi:hypothetical protein